MLKVGIALQAASFGGHTAIVQWLLLWGTDIGCAWKLPQAASYSGHKVIVQLLLEKGADVNAQGGTWKQRTVRSIVQGT